MPAGHELERFLRNAVITDDFLILLLFAEEGEWREEPLVIVFEAPNDLERLFSELKELVK